MVIRKTAAIRYPVKLLAMNSDIIKTRVPVSLILGSSRCRRESV
jgi:hypothetical protein